jgi:tRNA U38,U39,U40 pseudouridine synthase TruA
VSAERRLALFRSALNLYEGWHPFHNFTNRAQYRTKQTGKSKSKKVRVSPPSFM